MTIHQRNVHALATEVFETVNDQNPVFMKNIFTLKEHQYFTRRKPLQYSTPRTMTYGLDIFGYKATQIWNAIPTDYRSDTFTIKHYIESHNEICNCNLCQPYFRNIGFIHQVT